MNPVLYYENYDNAGMKTSIKPLLGCICCTVTENINGLYELYCEYNPNFYDVKDIKVNMILQAKIKNKTDVFRIYEITKNNNGNVEIYAHHISYDLNHYCNDRGDYNSSMSLSEAISTIEHSCDEVEDSLNYIYTIDPQLVQNQDKHTFNLLGGVSGLRGYIIGNENSIANLWGVEAEFSEKNIHIVKRRGRDKTDEIVLKENIDIVRYTVTTSSEDVYTHILPFYRSKGNTVVGKIEKISKYLTTPMKILSLDTTSYFGDTIPTINDLMYRAFDYADKHNIFDNLSINEKFNIEYNQKSEALQSIELGDTVTANVYNSYVPVRCTETIWNVLEEKYDNIILDTDNTTFVDTINAAVDNSKYATVTDLNNALNTAVNEEYYSNATSMCVGTIAGGGRVLAFFLPYYKACGNEWNIDSLTISTRLYEGVVGYLRSGTNGDVYSQISGLQVIRNGAEVRTNEIESFEVTATEHIGLRFRLQFKYPIAVNNNDPTATKNNTSMLVQIGSVKVKRLS